MQIFAHRGASGTFPENTLLAFEQALAEQCDGIELDVQLVDGQPIVFHDRELSRCTNGRGPLRALSYAQLRALDAGQGERIPHLYEVLELIAGRCILNVEIKQLAAAESTLALLQTSLKQTGWQAEQLIISSFDHRVITQFAPHYPAFEFAALTASVPHQLAQFASAIPCHAIHADIDSYSTSFVADAKQRKLAFRVYTVDDEQEIRAMQQNGIDAIFTNVPARAVALRQNTLCAE